MMPNECEKLSDKWWVMEIESSKKWSQTAPKSHDTIHIFKNYFTTLFSVFNEINCIQTDSQSQKFPLSVLGPRFRFSNNLDI